ncbi:MAG: B-box zinc finger protein, partial [archaeon]|nr:B-box zinc finger protein [archaeon]
MESVNQSDNFCIFCGLSLDIFPKNSYLKTKCKHKICINCIFNKLISYISSKEHKRDTDFIFICECNKKTETKLRLKEISNIVGGLANFVTVDIQNKFCNIHPKEKLISFCKDCKINLCSKCFTDHYNHNKKEFSHLKSKLKDKVLKSTYKEYKKFNELFETKQMSFDLKFDEYSTDLISEID